MKRIVLAAGHFGPGTGAHGIVDEGREVVELVDDLAVALKRRGLTVVKVPHKLDLAPEIAYIKQHVAPGAIAVECHMNWASNPRVRGICATYTRGDWASWRLARRIVKTVTARGLMPAWGKGVYRSVEIAAMRGWHDLGWHSGLRGYHPVLVECGFCTSRIDAWLMKDGTRKYARLVDAIADAIVAIAG